MKGDPRYINRRRMAWLSFWFIFFVGGILLLLGSTDSEAAVRIEKLSFLIGTVFGVFTSIVISYFTASVFTDVNDVKFKNQNDHQPPAGGR